MGTEGMYDRNNIFMYLDGNYRCILEISGLLFEEFYELAHFISINLGYGVGLEMGKILEEIFCNII
jgi:hypothetical protein